MLGFCLCENAITIIILPGAGAGAAGAGAGAAGCRCSSCSGCARCSGAPGAPGAGVLRVLQFRSSAGFCSSFLQATTARDKEAKKSTLTKMANIFFLNYPPFKFYISYYYSNFRSSGILRVLSRQI